MDPKRLFDLATQFGAPVIFVHEGEEYVISRLSDYSMVRQSGTKVRKDSVPVGQGGLEQVSDHEKSLLDKIAFPVDDGFTTHERISSIHEGKESSPKPNEPTVESLLDVAEISTFLGTDILMEERFTIIPVEELS